MPVKKTTEKKSAEFKTCPYCWNEIRAKAVKCQYCWEFLDESKKITRTTTKKKELQIQDLPDKWDYLNERQKEVLIKNFPLKGWYKVAVFFFPWIFLLYARRYRLYVLLLVASLVPGLNVIVSIVARIVICANWESICYNKDSINMKRALMQYRKQWDKESPDYDNSEIYGHVNGWRIWVILLLIPSAILVLWILIVALMPRMQSAQGRARDVSRMTALSQIQSAIVTYQGDYGKWPWMDRAKNWIPVSEIQSELTPVGMSYVPNDPLSNNKNSWLGNATSQSEYLYMVSKRNGVDNWWFVLMAKTEVPWSSNWVVCDDGEWKINTETDLSNITLCNTVVEWNYCSNSNWHCTYSSEGELRYILTF